MAWDFRRFVNKIIDAWLHLAEVRNLVQTFVEECIFPDLFHTSSAGVAHVTHACFYFVINTFGIRS
jgi:hypothetical protein